jgi:RNA polymerase sigma-70 factor (ECF subfamily)
MAQGSYASEGSRARRASHRHDGAHNGQHDHGNILRNELSRVCFDAAVSSSDEQEMRRPWEAGDYHTATKLALERYGREIYGVLAATLKSESDADDVFSQFALDLWRGMPGFQWRSSMRSWAHRIARNAAMRWATSGARKPARNLPIEQSAILELAERVRSQTRSHLRTEVKSQVRLLREELDEFEQRLLILRVDRQMEWEEIAVVFADDDAPSDDLKRAVGRLRKRFQHVVNKLRKLARARGLLDD